MVCYDTHTLIMKREEKNQYDCIVVGAGIAGLSTAYHLLKDKRSVLVLEAGTGLDNASFNSNAIMSHDPDAKWDLVVKKFGTRGVKDLWALAELSIQKLTIFAHTTKPHFKTERLVARIYSNSKIKTKKLYQQFLIYKRAGVRAHFFSQGEKLHTAFDSYIEIPQEGQTNNQAMLKNLAGEISKLGGKIIRQTPVATVSYTKELVTLTTKKGKVFFGSILILATGTQTLLPEITPTTQVKRAFIVQYKKHKMPEFYTQAVYWDNEEPYHYIRSFKGNVLWVGGGDVYEKDYDSKIDYYKGIEQYAHQSLSLDKSYKREFTWSGTFYPTENGLPHIAKLSQAPIYVNYGFGGTGILTTFISGYLLASWMRGKEKKYERLFKAKK